MVKFIDKWKWRLTSRFVPCVEISDNGHSLDIYSSVADAGNVLKESWNEAGWEKRDNSTLVRIRVDGRILGYGYYVHPKGMTLKIDDHVQVLDKNDNIIEASFKGHIGALTTAHIMRDFSELVPTMREKLIWMAIGIGLGMFIFGPAFSKALS